MGYKDTHEENLKLSKIILPWVRQCNANEIRIGAGSVAKKFNISRYYAEYLVTHYLTEMSADFYPGEVLQVTQARGWIISSEFFEDSQRAVIGKRKQSNTIAKRAAIISKAVGTTEEKRLAEVALAKCQVEKLEIEIDEGRLRV